MKPENLFKEEDFSHVNEEGNKIYRIFIQSERYRFDFDKEMQKDGWEQYDTDQDAWYFGVWINKKSLMTLSYAEGDLSLVKCDDVDKFNAQIKSMNEFYDEGFIAKTFDENGMTIYQQDRNKFYVRETA